MNQTKNIEFLSALLEDYANNISDNFVHEISESGEETLILTINKNLYFYFDLLQNNKFEITLVENNSKVFHAQIVDHVIYNLLTTIIAHIHIRSNDKVLEPLFQNHEKFGSNALNYKVKLLKK